MKELTTTELRNGLGDLRNFLEKGPVRIIWREQKPNGKEVFSAILTKEGKKNEL